MDNHSQHGEPKSVSRAVGRSRAFRARLQRRRRRSVLLATGAAVAVALAFEFSVASFGGMSMAEAAANQAKSLSELLDQRSPGARTQGELTKTKFRHRELTDREVAPTPILPKNLTEVLAPPPPIELTAADIDTPVAELTPVVPSPPGEILLPPPPGGIIPPGGKPPPGGPPSAPPPTTPPGEPPPALPEPGTWMTMILGFGMIGWSIRRARAFAPASSAGRAFR